MPARRQVFSLPPPASQDRACPAPPMCPRACRARVAQSGTIMHLWSHMQRKIPITRWARQNGVSRMTAWRMATSGSLPGAALSPAGRWLVEVDEPEPVRLTVAYARVASHDQTADLDRQVARIAEWAAANGTHIARYVREIGSGLNDNRRELGALLADPAVAQIVVERRDRLARFGVAQLEQALAASTRSILVIDPGEVEDDRVQDMVDLMTCFSARLYGRRSARNRAQRALAALQATREE
jgi:putative resolvase